MTFKNFDEKTFKILLITTKGASKLRFKFGSKYCIVIIFKKLLFRRKNFV